MRRARAVRGRPPWTRVAVRLAVLVGCLALAATVRSSPEPAAASSATLGVGYKLPHVGFMGSYTVNGQRTFCIDLNGQGPSTASGYLAKPGTEIRTQVGWTPDHAGGNASAIRGSYLTTTQLGQLAYLLDRYAGTNSAATAVAAEHLVRALTVGDSAQIDREKVRWVDAVRSHPAVAATFEAISRDVAAHAGPYHLTSSWTTKPTVSAPGVLAVQVVSNAGTPMPAVPVVVRYIGDLTGTPVSVSTGKSGTASATVPVTAAGALSLTVTATGLPNDVPVLYTPRGYGNPRTRDYSAQRTVGRAARISVVGTATADVSLAVPTVTTAVSAATVPAATPLTDTITVKGTAPGYTGEATASLWGPFSKKPTATDCATQSTPVGKVTVTVTGDGTVTTPSIDPPSAGYYTWTIDLAGSATQAAVSTPCAATKEIVQVSPPVVPTVTTVAGPATANVGDALTDAITVKGSAPGYSASATASLWGPFTVKPVATDCANQAAPAGQVSVDVAGDATVTTPSVTASSPGYYTWTIDLPASPAQTAVSTACAVAAETTLVKAAPQVSLTTIGTKVPGDPVHAEFSVTGSFTGSTAAAALGLYGPFAAAPGATDCSPAKRRQQATVSLAGDGTYDSDDVPLSNIGYYTWTLSVPSSANQSAVSVSCGSTDGTFQVARADLGGLSMTNTSTAGATAPSGTAPAVGDPQLDIPAAGIAAPLVSVGSLGAGIAVPDDPSLAGQFDQGSAVGDPYGTIVIAGRPSDAHNAPGGLFNLAAVTTGAAVTLKGGHGKTQKFTVDSVQTLPRTQDLPASLFTQTTPLQLVIISATDPVHYGVGGSLVTHRSNVIVIATPS